ncbi:Hypothetical protein, putative [Bodo saltans]|uniref:Uncharacterized protein n=1 Tax=Bodo saltans TaxID=75058 RepID=A0A0S4JGR8_BODSA|nr:Hypothetical protein, putative [Bodo saltans]|eukprot:CUG87612.1 Hypothetical protein, putative [Bodo saltans]
MFVVSTRRQAIPMFPPSSTVLRMTSAAYEAATTAAGAQRSDKQRIPSLSASSSSRGMMHRGGSHHQRANSSSSDNIKDAGLIHGLKTPAAGARGGDSGGIAASATANASLLVSPRGAAQVAWSMGNENGEAGGGGGRLALSSEQQRFHLFDSTHSGVPPHLPFQPTESLRRRSTTVVTIQPSLGGGGGGVQQVGSGGGVVT